VVSACLITFCIFTGVRYISGGLSEKDYLKAGAGFVLIMFPAFFSHHIYFLKHFTLKDGKLLVKDLFKTEVISLGQLSSIKKINPFIYEIKSEAGNKFQTVFFTLNEKEWGRIGELLKLSAGK
jgi:hypothetical protein